MTRVMLDRTGIHIGWWYFARRYTVLITNLVLLETVSGRGHHKGNWKRGKDYGVGNVFWSEVATRHLPRMLV